MLSTITSSIARVSQALPFAIPSWNRVRLARIAGVAGVALAGGILLWRLWNQRKTDPNAKATKSRTTGESTFRKSPAPCRLTARDGTGSGGQASKSVKTDSESDADFLSCGEDEEDPDVESDDDSALLGKRTEDDSSSGDVDQQQKKAVSASCSIPLSPTVEKRQTMGASKKRSFNRANVIERLQLAIANHLKYLTIEPFGGDIDRLVQKLIAKVDPFVQDKEVRDNVLDPIGDLLALFFEERGIPDGWVTEGTAKQFKKVFAQWRASLEAVMKDDKNGDSAEQFEKHMQFLKTQILARDGAQVLRYFPILFLLANNEADTALEILTDEQKRALEMVKQNTAAIEGFWGWLLKLRPLINTKPALWLATTGLKPWVPSLFEDQAKWVAKQLGVTPDSSAPSPFEDLYKTTRQLIETTAGLLIDVYWQNSDNVFIDASWSLCKETLTEKVTNQPIEDMRAYIERHSAQWKKVNAIEVAYKSVLGNPDVDLSQVLPDLLNALKS